MHSKRVHPHKSEAIVPDPLALPVQLVKRNRPVTWLAGISVVLVVFLLLLPPDIRTVFWHSFEVQAIPVSLLLIFSLVVISLVWSAGQRLDTWVFMSFNVRGPRPLWLDRIMVAFTQIGSAIGTLAIVLVFFLANDRPLSYELMLGTLTLWLVVELVKFVVHRSRPFIRLAKVRVVGYRPRGRSFPSGHTSQVFFMATLITQHFHASLWLAFLLYAIALLVGMTRMYVGAHYPRDVLAGAILGTAWGLMGVIVDMYVLNRIF